MVRFVVLAAPRTGSNWLCSLLDSHPEVVCHHELFNPERILYAVSCRAGVAGGLDRDAFGTVAARDADPLGFLRRVWREGSLGRPIVGFKLNRGQQPRVFAEVLADRRIRKLLLRRRNRLKTYVSEEIALRTEVWESYEWSRPAAAPGERPRIEVPLDDLARHIARNDGYYRELRRGLEGQGYLELDYESLGDPRQHVRALAFLGAREPEIPLQGATRKMNPCDLRELVAGYDELAAALRGTELADELSDPGP